MIRFDMRVGSKKRKCWLGYIRMKIWRGHLLRILAGRCLLSKADWIASMCWQQSFQEIDANIKLFERLITMRESTK